MNRAEQAQLTRQKLLDIALKLFSTQGYSKTSIRALARAAGLSDGILYHHFPQGKQQIFAVLLQQGVEHAFLTLSKNNLNLEQAPLLDVLNRLCELSVQLFTEHRDLLKIIMRESEAMQLNEMHWISQMFEARQQWLADVLAQRHQQGEIREMNFLLAAQQFMALNLQYGMSRLLNFSIGCDLSNVETRAEMLNQTLEFWAVQR